MKRLSKLFLFLSAVASLWAQTTSTSILGTVTDPSGAAIPGAKVTAIQNSTGVRREATTEASGDYSFPLIPVGLYTVNVESEGFKSATISNVTVQVNEKVRVDVQLALGSVGEQIEVTASAAQLKTDEASLGYTLEQKRLVELPLNGRNVGNLAVLQPGIQFSGARGGFDGQGGGGGIPIPGQNISIIANGQREANQHATLDGVIALEARVNTVPWSPSPEAMEEVKVISGSYSAEYGWHSGAQLLMVMRSGGNEFHGAAYDFFRNNVLDAESYFQNYFLTPGQSRFKKQGLQQNQFGFVVNGPVFIPKVYNGKDKTFFNFNYEGRRRNLPGNAGSALVPSDAFRNGDFSALLNQAKPTTIVDPYTGTPFPGNIIPQSRFAPAAVALNNFWPKAQTVLANPLAGFNYTNTTAQRINDDQYYVKVDHNFSDKDKFFGRYATNKPTWTQGQLNPNFAYLATGRNHNIATQWLHIFSPTVINEARYGWTQSKDDTFNSRANTDFSLDQIGLGNFRVITDNNRPLTPREAGIPSMNVAGFLGLSEPDGGNGFDNNQLHQVNDNLTIMRGTHNFKMGIDLHRVSLFRGAANVPRGSFNFNGNVAGNSYAQFLLGVPTSTDTPEGLPLTDVRQTRFGFYFQDDWKATRKLTVNIGLRYEYNTPATDIQGLWRSGEWRNGLAQPLQFVPDQIRTVYQFYNPQKNMFQPRIGLAYRATEDWVIRAGYGIYYNVHQLNNYTILNLNPPLSGSSNFANNIQNQVLIPGSPVYTFDNPFGTPNPASATSANVLNTDNFQPVVNQWSFDIQRRLPGAMILTVGYVGSKTSHMDNTVEKNNPDPAFNTATSTLQSRRPYQFISDNGILRPLTRLRWLDSGANAWYQGMQVHLQKRFTKGLLFGVSYTYSKTMMEGYGRNEGGGTFNTTYQDPRNRAAEKSRASFDLRQNLVMNFVYQVPIPEFLDRGVGKVVFGGWQTNGIITMRSGLPFSVQQGNLLNTANSAVRPERVGTGELSNPTINQWYNPDDFHLVTCANTALPSLCHYGSSGNGILSGPSNRVVDFSAFKNFNLYERLQLQFRAEFFNLFNTPQFFIPNQNLNTGSSYVPSVGANGQPVFPSQANIVQGPGAITSTVSSMRNIQFGLKFIF